MPGQYRTVTDLVNLTLSNLGVLVAGQTPDIEDFNLVMAITDPVFRKLNALDICQIPDPQNIPSVWFKDLADVLAGEACTEFGVTMDDYVKLINKGLGGAQGVDVGSGAAAKSLRQINRGRYTQETVVSYYF